MEERFHDKLKVKMHAFVTFAYRITEKFPRSELYGIISQLRRAAISIILNYLEGYARKREKVKLTFYEISHGSAQESRYLVFFSHCQSWITNEEYQRGLAMINEIGKMLWSTMEGIELKINSGS